jgi:uncharacterized protein (TIGR03435 family)
MNKAITIVGVLAVTAVASAQFEIPRNNHYEVVSIRPGVSAESCKYHVSPIQFLLENCSLRYLIGNVYNAFREYDLAGLPKWASSETFTFNAKSIAPANPGEQWGMLRPVLEDRFKLKYHREKRQMPVYLFSAATGGIRFPETAPGSCTPIDPNAPPVERKTPVDAKTPMNDCGRFLNQILPGGGVRVRAKAITMAQLARPLGQYFDRPVVEQTGSSKLFDVDLSSVKSDLIVSDTNADPSGLPTIFDALKKVGLRATPGQGAVEVLVIDQLERPSEN